MTGVLQLDLSAERDEGLLVPFGGSNRKVVQEPPTRRPFFFFRKQQQHDKENNSNEANPTKQKKQVVTFSFPNAPVEHMEGPREREPSPTRRQESKEHEKDKEKTEDSESEEESETCEEDEPQRTSPSPAKDHGDSDNDSFHEAPPILPKMEGHGTPVEEDNALHAMGRFFRRMSKRSDMKSMKIATEATKDDKTLGEHVTHVLQVAIAPEIYAEDEEGEGNLGFYRPIRRGPTPSEEWRDLYKKQTREFKSRISKMKVRIRELQEELRTKDLEVRSWKHRCQELERQLRESKQEGNDDDSSTGPRESAAHDDDADSESGIDHEFTEDGPSKVEEGKLIDTNIVPEKVEFDPLSQEEKSSAPTADSGEDLMALSSLVSALVSMDEILTPTNKDNLASSSNAVTENTVGKESEEVAPASVTPEKEPVNVQ